MIHFSYPLQHCWRGLIQTTLFTAVFLLFQLTISAQSPGCTADAGTLDAIDICLLSDQTILKATNRGDTTVPDGFQVLYVLTHTGALIIEQVSNEPVFSLPDSLSGIYTIHTLVYNPNTLNLNTIVLGQTTGFEVNALLIQGGGTICASLDLRGAKARFGSCEEECIATAGTLKATSNNCLRDGKATLNAAVQYAPIIPSGYARVYVLTSGDSLVIEQVSTTSSFIANHTGKFTIHTLVYDSTTLDLDTIPTGLKLNALLLQGGGTICGALDVAGAKFNVVACPPVCSAQAGKLKPDNDPCLQSGKATLIAKSTQNPIVPQGYQVRYLLTSGYGLVIQQINTTPSFVVNTTGLFTIHRLVYNPNTLNLNNIQLGTTQASTVNNWLIQGGGTICGALDLTGATFEIKVCPPPPCTAKAGHLKPENDPCLLDGKAILKAKYSYYPTVPNGYKVLYLLASGSDLVVEQKSVAASFTVYYTGKYTIHTLVYDPNTFNIASIYLGHTTIYDIKHLLIQGGGYICGALDVDGASFYIEECIVCNAKAGKIKSANEPCLLNDTATIKAQVVYAPVVPTGYAVRYLLATPWSNNLVIRQISKTPSFLVNSEGQYTIHTLVYDSTTLNLNTIKLNITTIYDVHKWLIQGGGDICGALALDLDIAKFYIEECEESPCPVLAGTLASYRPNLCLIPNSSFLGAYHSQQPTVIAGYKIKYVLTSGANLIIQKLSDTPNFQVSNAGTFRIHTLVYHPNTLDLADINLGVTKAADVNALLIQGGGSICGALDLQGATFQVSACNGNLNATGAINAFPNPTSGPVNLTFEKPEKVNTIQVELLDISGNLLKSWTFDGELEQTTLDISEIQSGMYNIRILYDNHSMQNIRVAKASY